MYLKQSWEWPPPFAYNLLTNHGRFRWESMAVQLGISPKWRLIFHGVGEALVVVVSKVMPAKSKVRELLVVVLPCNSDEGIWLSYLIVYTIVYIIIHIYEPLLAMGRNDWLIDPKRMGLQKGSTLSRETSSQIMFLFQNQKGHLHGLPRAVCN